MYICGPTVSGEPHLGHGRFTVAWDVFRRYLRWSGLDVKFVSNVTDIEDKILAKAADEGRSPEEVAAFYEQMWWDTQDRLGVMRPDETPHATAYVERMVQLIARLVERGHAYVGGDGVYFAAESVDGYGLLARQPVESLRAGARVDVSEEAGKRSPIDSCCGSWPAGEPSWQSPWGRVGRAGTPSAWSCPSICWARTSISTPAGSTWPSPITRTAGPGRGRRPPLHPTVGPPRDDR